MPLINAFRMDGLGNRFIIIDRREKSINIPKEKIIHLGNLKSFHRNIEFDQIIFIEKEINNVISTQDIFDTELLIRIERSGFKISEVPAKVNEIRPSVSVIFTRIPRTLKSLFLLRLQLFKESLNTNNL